MEQRLHEHSLTLGGSLCRIACAALWSTDEQLQRLRLTKCITVYMGAFTRT